MNPLLEVLCNEINKLKKALTTTGSDYTATVTKVEGDTAYVQMSGSDISDTPVALSVNAAEGDHVRVRVANGKAWITGNDTLPPSNDKKEVGTKMMKNMSDRDDDIIIDFGKMEFIGNTLVVDSDNFKLDADGDAKFSGTLEAAGGSFSGAVRISGTYGETIADRFLQHIVMSPDGASPFVIKGNRDDDKYTLDIGAHNFRMERLNESSATIEFNYILMSPDYLNVQDGWAGQDYGVYITKDKIRIRNFTQYTDYDKTGAHPSSDIRLKEDITKIDSEMARRLLPVKFRFKGDDKLHYGFIAQDVQKVMPDVVHEGEDGYLTLTYHELIAPLCALVQEQEDRINQLEIRLKALEDKK